MDMPHHLAAPNTAQIVIHRRRSRNRQVRRMIEAVESKVLKLVRTAIGPIRIDDLPIGRWRELTPEEVDRLLGGTEKRGDG